MRYNVMIFGKRYRNKTKEFIIDLATKYSQEINNNLECGIYGVSFDLVNMNDSLQRLAYFDNLGKVVISINRVK